MRSTPGLYLWAIGIWFLFLVVAFALGTVRELVVSPLIGEHAAHIVGTSFEFLFFHFVGGKEWDELLADYNVAEGRVWVLVLLTTLFGAPAIHEVLRRRSR